MTHQEMVRHVEAEYPYDFAKCGLCATQHARTDNSIMPNCSVRSHVKMRAEARKLFSSVDNWPSRRVFLAFRRRWAKFYPKQGGAKHAVRV